MCKAVLRQFQLAFTFQTQKLSPNVKQSMVAPTETDD